MNWVYELMRPSASYDMPLLSVYHQMPRNACCESITQPCRLQERLNTFKSAHNWDSHTWVGVHIRRRDHATQPFFQEHWKKHNVSLNVKIDKQIDGNFKELPYPYWWQVCSSVTAVLMHACAAV